MPSAKLKLSQHAASDKLTTFLSANFDPLAGSQYFFNHLKQKVTKKKIKQKEIKRLTVRCINSTGSVKTWKCACRGQKVKIKQSMHFYKLNITETFKLWHDKWHDFFLLYQLNSYSLVLKGMSEDKKPLVVIYVKQRPVSARGISQ